MTSEHSGASICSTCHHPLTPGAKFCGNCGAPVPRTGGKTTDEDIWRFIDEESETRKSMGAENIEEEIRKMESKIESVIGDSKSPLMDETVQAEPPAPTSRSEQQRMRVKTRDLRVEVEYMRRINPCLLHNELPVIWQLVIGNCAGEAAENGLVKCWLSPDYGEYWQRTFPVIAPGKKLVIEGISMPVRLERLQRIVEAEKASLRVEVEIDDHVCFSDTYPVEILAYNEWFDHPLLIHMIASLIKPNDSAVEQIMTYSRSRLATLCGEDGFNGYQSKDPEKVRKMAEAIYLSLQKDLDISYINPPASFERNGQKVRFPAQILEHRRGTCLDLALLYAGCLENAALHPIIFLVRGHAFLGCMLSHDNLDESILTDREIIKKMVEKNALLTMNSTTFTNDTSTFDHCIEEGKKCLEGMHFEYAIDVKMARREGIKPLP